MGSKLLWVAIPLALVVGWLFDWSVDTILISVGVIQILLGLLHNAIYPPFIFRDSDPYLTNLENQLSAAKLVGDKEEIERLSNSIALRTNRGIDELRDCDDRGYWYQL